MDDSRRRRLDGWPAPLRIPLRRLAAVARGTVRVVLRSVRRLAPRRLAASWRFVAATASQLRTRQRSRELTVGVDVNSLWEPLTGVGWYLYLLLRGLAELDGIRLRLYGPDLVGDGRGVPPSVELPAGDAVEVVRYVVPHDLSLPPSLVVRVLRLLEPLLVAADRNRVLFAPNFFLPRRFALARGAVVATVHDLAFRLLPSTVRDETRRDLARHLDRTLKRACRVITPSHRVRSELVEEGMITAERVVAVHHGPGHLAVGAIDLAAATPSGLATGIPRPYALHVGTLEPRKNLSMLLAAWRRARSRSGAVPPLVLCGGYGWKSDELRRAVAGAQQEGWAIHPGYVDAAALRALYADALFVVCPSLYEGFGLPVVEAMSVGTPVVCSDLAVFREVAADGAHFVPPDDEDAWSEALVQLSEDEGLREGLAGRGRSVAAGLSWARAVGETLDVLRAAGATVRR